MNTILLIESDAALAQTLADALRARGFGVEVAADGQDGVELARASRPAAIVLAVELPRTSGYAICNKLKKDDQLRAIPLVITSAAGTEETFEQHRNLKTRAEDYLLKPFAPETLVERLGALVGLPGVTAASEPGPEVHVAVEAEPDADAESQVEVEVVGLDDVEELESTIAALDAAARSPDDPQTAQEDPELLAFDEAFESLAARPGSPSFPVPPAAPAPEPAPDPVAPAFEPQRPDPEVAPEDRATAQAREGAEDEAARLQDRISELRVEAARAAEERERLSARLAAAERERDEARARAAELEATVAKHEARVVKAYERLKGDEAVKEKTRRALAIALQLLEDGAGPPRSRDG